MKEIQEHKIKIYEFPERQMMKKKNKLVKKIKVGSFPHILTCFRPTIIAAVKTRKAVFIGDLLMVQLRLYFHLQGAQVHSWSGN